MDPAHFIGYQMAPWMQTGEAYRRLLFRGSELLAEAKAAVEGRAVAPRPPKSSEGAAT